MWSRADSGFSTICTWFMALVWLRFVTFLEKWVSDYSNPGINRYTICITLLNQRNHCRFCLMITYNFILVFVFLRYRYPYVWGCLRIGVLVRKREKKKGPRNKQTEIVAQHRILSSARDLMLTFSSSTLTPIMSKFAEIVFTEICINGKLLPSSQSIHHCQMIQRQDQ